MANIGYVRDDVSEAIPRWELVDDVVAGPDVVKRKGAVYLPIPNEGEGDADNLKAYQPYLERARLYPATERTLNSHTGQVFSKEPETDLPSILEPMVADVDGDGISLVQQSKDSLRRTLKHGRAGILVDFPQTTGEESRASVQRGDVRPRLLPYKAEQIINWRTENRGGKIVLSMLMLYENVPQDDDGYEFTLVSQWREYRLEENGQVAIRIWRKRSSSEDRNQFSDGTGTNKPQELDRAEGKVAQNEYQQVGGDVFPTKAGGEPLTEIPFCFIGAVNNDPAIDPSPLYPLADLNIGWYRNSADLEQMLFRQGHPLLVYTGITEYWKETHLKGKIHISSRYATALNEGADAKFIEISDQGSISAEMVRKEEQMRSIGAKLIEPKVSQTSATESAIRESSDTSVLASVANNVSSAYEKALGIAAEFLTEEEKEITFKLNTEFTFAVIGADQVREIKALYDGGGIDWDEYRSLLKRANYAHKDNEEALENIRSAEITLE